MLTISYVVGSQSIVSAGWLEAVFVTVLKGILTNGKAPGRVCLLGALIIQLIRVGKDYVNPPVL